MIQDVIAVAKKYYPEPITVEVAAKESGCSKHSLVLNIRRISKKNHKYPIIIEREKSNLPRGRMYITYVPGR